MGSRILTIVLTDMKGFTETSSKRSREGVMSLLEKHDELIRPAVERLGGRVVKTIGDAFLVVFESPTNGVLSGLVIQHLLREHNKAVQEEERIEVRVAINAGEVQETENDVFGDPVNLAARICAITDPGEVYFTEAVYLAMNRTEVPSSEVGERTFKGIPEPVRLLRVTQDPMSDQYRNALDRYSTSTGHSISIPSARRSGLAGWLLLLGLFAVGIGIVLLLLPGEAWQADVRALAAADGYSEAWNRIDERFRNDPSDQQVKVLGAEILDLEVRSLIARDGYETALARLTEHREARDYLTVVDAVRRGTRREWGLNLTEGEGHTEAYFKGLNLLHELWKEEKEDVRAYVEYLDAYADVRGTRPYHFARHAGDILKLDRSLASDPRIRDRLLQYFRERAVYDSSSDAEAFYDLVAEHYGADVLEESRPLVTSADDREGRVASYGVVSRLESIPEARLFEYHRLNLFQGDKTRGRRLDQAEAFFKDWVAEKKDAAPYLQAYDSIPVLDRYGSAEARRARPFLEGLFFDSCRKALVAGLTAADETGRRFHSWQILSARGAITPELRHRYHMSHLLEFGSGEIQSGRYTYLTEMFEYLTQGPIDRPPWRAEAAEAARKALKYIDDVREYNKGREKQIEWLEEQLNAVLGRLGE